MSAVGNQTAEPVPVTGQVNLRGLAPRAVAEVLYGLQQRAAAEVTSYCARRRPSLAELPVQDEPARRALVNSLVAHLGRAFADPRTEIAKDRWDLTVLEHHGWLTFTGISQDWLRKAADALEAQHVIGPAQRIVQVTHPRRRDRQRTASRAPRAQSSARGRAHSARQSGLPGGHLQNLQLSLVMRRPNVLDIPRSPPRRVHDLHRRTRRRRHRPHIRGHQATLRPRISAQIRSEHTKARRSAR